MNLTLEERERLAYINGDVQLAAALGEALDLQAELEEIDELVGGKNSDER